MTPEEKAREDLMILGLKQAVDNGYSMATPGSSKAVREAFPDLFADANECAGVSTTDELELDDHPMVSRGDDGCFVQTWSWVPAPEQPDPDGEDEEIKED